MAQTIVLNGVSYSIPDVGNTGWGSSLTALFVALPNGVLQKTGGNFTLTAEVNFGATYGLTSTYFKSRTSTISTAGVLRLAVSDSIGFRNNADDGNLLFAVDGSDRPTFNSAILATQAAAFTPNYAIYANGSGVLAAEAALAKVRGGSGQDNSSLTFPASGTLATLAGTETLSNKTFSDAPVLAEISTPTTPSSGFGKIYFKSDGFLYQLNDDGSESKVGAGSGGVNYISNPDAESNVTGWATYADAAGNVPVNGTGGSPSSTWTRSTSSPLVGSASFLWTKAGSADRQGEGVSYDFTIAAADKAQMLSIEFSYIIGSGTFVASDAITPPLMNGTTSTNAGNSDLEVFIYDVTNSVLIPVSPAVLISNSSGVAQTFKGIFQTASNSTSYRLIIHTATASTANYTVKFDRFFVGPQQIVQGPAVGDWESWTPTGSWVTNTTYTGLRKRIGDHEWYQVKVQLTGAPNSADLTINLPITIDTAKVIQTAFESTNAQNVSLGNVTIVDYAAQTYSGQVYYNTSTSVGIMVEGADATFVKKSQAVNATTPHTFANNDNITIVFSVPVAGWSSNNQMSNEAASRVVTFEATSASSAVADTSTPIVYETIVNDSHNGYNGTTTYTIPVSGPYRVFAQAFAGSAWNISLYANGSLTDQGTYGSASQAAFLYRERYYVAGTTLTIRPQSSITMSNTATSAFFSVSMIQGPTSITATDSVGASWGQAATQAIADATATVMALDTTVYDSSNGTSGLGTTSFRWTTPVSGKFLVTMSVEFQPNATNDRIIYVYKNGALYRALQFISVNSGSYITQCCGTTVVPLVAGDYISFAVFQRSTGSLNIAINGVQYNHATVTRVGN